MNIEESIDNVKFIIGDLKASNYNQTFIQAIEILLTAYEKEKEERKRIGKLYYEANENCIKYEKELEKEKEKNESLIKERATEIVYVDKNFVRKDKIKPIQIIDLDGKIHNVYKIEEE